MDERYSMKIEDMGIQEADLLECLTRIDLGKPLDPRASDLLDRLVDAGLVDRDKQGEVSLTTAGIERAQSLHHRVSGDREAARILKGRKHD